MILTIRTDNPQAEIALYDDTGTMLSNHQWHAHRELSTTLLSAMQDELAKLGADWPAVTGIVVYRGPGSFTGLRIGITVANTLAYGLQIPIIGTMGDTWQTDGIARLRTRQNDAIVLPNYGAEAHITLQKK